MLSTIKQLFNYLISCIYNRTNIKNDNSELKIKKNDDVELGIENNIKIIKNTNIYDNNYYYLSYNKNNQIYTFKEALKNNKVYHKTNINKKILKQINKKIYINNNNILYKITDNISYDKYINIIIYIKNNDIKNIVLPINIYKQMSYNNNEISFIQTFNYYKHGDLLVYIQQNNIKYYEIYNIIYQLVNIIKDLHNIDISHRDIKPENIIINYKPNLTLHLIDLEYSDYSKINLNFRGGSYAYASPELLNRKFIIQDFKCVDIWAISIILYILICRSMPWEIADYSCIYYNMFLADKYFIYKNIFKKDIPINHISLYNKIFNYGFNLNYSNRNDIVYISNLL